MPRGSRSVARRPSSRCRFPRLPWRTDVNATSVRASRNSQVVSNSPTRRVAVALQGGGSHGAFTWGVLDRLLQEPDFEIVGISGTSAGAMNAGILADGLRRGGRAEAREALAQYWEDVGRVPGYASLAFPA